MGDMGDDFAAMKAHTQAKHAEWKRKNMAVLSDSGAVFTVTNGGETLLFRQTGYPRVDFYPSTGRWRVADVKETYRGGAKRFLEWYRAQYAV
jgi:hypothetical protein